MGSLTGIFFSLRRACKLVALWRRHAVGHRRIDATAPVAMWCAMV
jgi:hypothetical protein